MSKSNLTSLNLLEIVSNNLDFIIPVLKPNTETYDQLISVLQYDDTLDEHVMESSILTTYLQIVNLLSLTQFGGISIPEINKVTQNESLVDVYWANGVKDTLTIGKFDNAYKRFLRTTYNKLFGTYLNTDVLSPKIITEFNLKILDNQSSILTLIESIDIILNKARIENYFNENLNQEFMFMLLSSFSVEHLNTLFNQISLKIPQDLEITTQNKNKLNMQQYFLVSSLDISLLIEKISMLYELSFIYNHTILQDIVKKEVPKFIGKTLSNNVVLNQVQNTVNSVKKNQLLPRQELNNIFIKHFDKILQYITTAT